MRRTELQGSLASPQNERWFFFSFFLFRRRRRVSTSPGGTFQIRECGAALLHFCVCVFVPSLAFCFICTARIGSVGDVTCWKFLRYFVLFFCIVGSRQEMQSNTIRGCVCVCVFVGLWDPPDCLLLTAFLRYCFLFFLLLSLVRCFWLGHNYAPVANRSNFEKFCCIPRVIKLDDNRARTHINTHTHANRYIQRQTHRQTKARACAST